MTGRVIFDGTKYFNNHILRVVFRLSNVMPYLTNERTKYKHKYEKCVFFSYVL